MDKPWKHAKWKSQTQRSHIVWLHLHEMLKIGQFIDTKNKLVFSRSLGGEEEWGETVNGYEVSFGVMKMI